MTSESANSIVGCSPSAYPIESRVASGFSLLEDMLLLYERHLLRDLEAEATDDCLDTIWLCTWEPQRYADSIVAMHLSQ